MNIIAHEGDIISLGDYRLTVSNIALPTWAFPIGEGKYTPDRWYAASRHTPYGSYRHIGIDYNLDISPWGDVERTLGLSVFSLTDGEVVYYTSNWSGVPMIVLRYEHASFLNGNSLWVRYAHITPIVQVGDCVVAGQRLGGFADWGGSNAGDHLHLDMATVPYTTEYLSDLDRINFIDPVPVLKEHLDPDMVERSLNR